LVPNEPEGKTDQDRREGRQPRALCCVSDGRGRNPTNPIRRHLAVDRRIAAAGRIDSVGRSSVLCFDSNSRERCVLRTENSALLAAQQGLCSFRRHRQPAATILACWKRRTGADLRSGPRPSGECRFMSLTPRRSASLAMYTWRSAASTGRASWRRLGVPTRRRQPIRPRRN
jgi:hypothetical protein